MTWKMTSPTLEAMTSSLLKERMNFVNGESGFQLLGLGFVKFVGIELQSFKPIKRLKY